MSKCVLRALLVVLFAGIACGVRAADPATLWHIVHDRCVPDAQAHGDPAPCTAVDLAHGDAVLKDIRGATQFLLIPTARVGGIEDPAVLAAGAPNYWADAWYARRYVMQRAGHALPRDAIALAINAPGARSQDQLHIHVDCVRPDVRATLLRDQAAIGTRWARFPGLLAGGPYRAMRVAQAELGTLNPFRLLAADAPPPDLARHGLAVIGARFDGKPGFILLDAPVDAAAGSRGWTEALLDHGCALAH